MNPKKFIVYLLTAAVLQACNTNQPASEEAKTLFNSIIPKPVSATLNGQTFVLNEKTAIRYNGEGDVARIANMLATTLRASTGFGIPVTSDEAGNNVISLTLSDDAALGNEGYELNIADKSITIKAFKPAGIFFGTQTLKQLFPGNIESTQAQKGPWQIATGTIRDLPVYAWRATMLDVARHFFSVDEVKRYIDYTSLYKINVLHLGLTNDQGWRIEIKSWPRLTEHGGKTEVGGGPGGFYTQEQYKELVAYAAERYITIVPEIDLPGHTNAALASYGELNAGIQVPKEGRIEVMGGQILGKDRPTELYTGTEVGFSTLSLKKPATMKFLNDIIRELAEITPGPYIHIGGDEAHVTQKEEYIKFVGHFAEIVKKNNKIMIGWEEIAQGGIDSSAIAQHWANEKYPIMASEKGARIILSPANRVYLDMQYDSTSKLGLHWAAYIEVKDAYDWEPSTHVAGIDKTKILGVEAALWGETITDLNDIEYLLFPRLPGIAEVAWTPADLRNWDDYRVRLGNHAKRYKALGIDYYQSKQVPWVD